jgi:NTE family protein
VGLALGGGYALGLAHIGVLEVFEREGIPVDMIAGTSVGALVGALYARQIDVETMKKHAAELDWLSMTSLLDLTLPKSGLIRGKRVTKLIQRLIGDVKFSDLKIPLACVATDIITGDEVVMSEGSVLEAIRSSISIPIIFSLVKNQGKYLVDGGLVNPVPVSVQKGMGADFLIAVDVTPDNRERAQYLIEHSLSGKVPGILQVVMQSMYINSFQIARSFSKDADIILRPHLAHIGPSEFTRARECILEGELAAVDCMAQLKRRLVKAGIDLIAQR